MVEQTTAWNRFVGCDVGKTVIVVFDSATGRTARLANQPKALAAFAAALDQATLAICEATGGYEADLLDALAAAGRAAHRADARKVKAFIRSLGALGKSDRIDAKGLADYGRERCHRLPLWQPREAVRERLQVLVATRRDLVAERLACRNRLTAPGAAPVAPRLTRLLAAIEAEIAGLDAEIKALIDSSAPLKQARAVLGSLAGVGPTTAATLLALMPELGTLDRHQAAALAGLAPHPRQSGARDGYRRVRGGRPEVKRALFMAALAAARSKGSLSAFYQRLRANGKKPLVALTALMRKLIVIANARLRDALNRPADRRPSISTG